LSNVGYQGKNGSDWNIVKLPRITLGDIHVSRMTALPTAGFADPLLWNINGRCFSLPTLSLIHNLRSRYKDFVVRSP